MFKIQHVKLRDKRVLIRSDLNVAVVNGDVASAKRIESSLDTVRYALAQNSAVILISHFGRPQEGVYEERFSLMSIHGVLQDMLGRDVRFVRNWIDGVDVEPGEVVLCENVRFLPGETSCSSKLSRKLASLCDVYVMDAFGASHRDHASITGVVEYAEKACMGLLFQHEIESLDAALQDPVAPLVSIVGGAKIQGKLQALKRLSEMSQTLIVGGGIANTFLAASGHRVGNSLCEPSLIKVAKKIMKKAHKFGCEIPMPADVVVAPGLHETQSAVVKRVSEVSKRDMILDIGVRTREQYMNIIAQAGTIIWNGPVGAFETDPFGVGTSAVAKAVADSSAFSVAGGGDTIAALEKNGIEDQISYLSTGGGAFLEYVQGKRLYSLVALEKHVENLAG